MAQLTIEAKPREELGKSATRRIRLEGKVPAVIYGHRLENNINIQLDAVQMEKLLHSQGAGGLIEVSVDGETQVALVKDIQRDPVLGKLLHIDFHAVAMDEDVRVTVPINFVGEDDRANDGGIVSQHLREVEVDCLPTAIPDQLQVDISGLGVGDSLTVKDITFPEGVRPATDEDETIVSIVLPAEEPAGAEEAEAVAEGEEAEAAAEEAEAAEGDGGAEEDAE